MTIPRLKSSIWVAALLRQCSVNGSYCAVLHKGAEEAGAIYVVFDRGNGTYDLLGPPPGTSIDDNGNRHFLREFSGPQDWRAVGDMLNRKRRYDPDIWAVEIELKAGFADLLVEQENN